MSWYKFWKAGIKAADRLTTAALTMILLRQGGYLAISWWFIAYWVVCSIVIGILCIALAAWYEPSEERCPQ